MATQEPAPDDVLIAVMGLTGSGKSSFINLATQSKKPLAVGHSVKSCTDTVDRAEPFMLDNRRIFLFDTPGFDDTNKTESEILRIIAIELEKQYRKGQTLHGIIYVHRISDLRVGGLAKANFGVFRKLCGDRSLQNVVIMTNMWTRVEPLEGSRRAAELATMDDFFKPALEKGAVMMHHKPDTVESAYRIIRQILKNHPLALAIQEEIVNKNKNINETSAGMALDEKIAQLAQQYEQKLKEQLEAAEAARRERDEETRKEQLEEAERVRKLLESLREEKSKQAEEYRKLQQQLEAAEKKRQQEFQDAQKKRDEDVRAAEARLLKAEEMMKKLTVSNDTPKQSTSQVIQASHGDIVSGEIYTLCNKQHGLYAAVAGSKIVLREYKEGDRHQQWRFFSDGSGDRWRIQSVLTRKYLSVTTSGVLHMHSNSSSLRLATEQDDDEYRIYYRGDEDEGQVIACERVRPGLKMTGRRVNLFTRLGGSDEVWTIEAD